MLYTTTLWCLYVVCAHSSIFVVLPLCGKKIVNTQYRRVWEKFGILGIGMFPTVNMQNAKQCSGASERKNLEPPKNNGWILRKHWEVLFCHIKPLSTGKNFLYPIPLFCIKLGTSGVLLRYFYPRKDL